MANAKSITRPARRSFLAALGAALAVPAASRAARPAPLKPDIPGIEEAARNLAAALEARHGERFRVTVDDEAGFVLIAAEPPPINGTSTAGEAHHEDGITPINPAWLQAEAAEWAETFESGTRHPVIAFGEIYATGGGGHADMWRSEALDIPREIAVDMMRWLEVRAAVLAQKGGAK